MAASGSDKVRTHGRRVQWWEVMVSSPLALEEATRGALYLRAGVVAASRLLCTFLVWPIDVAGSLKSMLINTLTRTIKHKSV
jgi:hypothetical protein